jgi:hypothetical protein
MDTLAFPIRFINNHVASLTESTDAYYNQLISLALQIAPGELALQLDFGTRDMTFSEPSDSAIRQTISFYFPEIAVTELEIFKERNTSSYSVNLSYVY